MSEKSSLYLDSMKKCLSASIYEQNDWFVIGSFVPKPKSPLAWLKAWLKAIVVKAAWVRGILLVKPNGAIWGLLNYTMIGRVRLDNIQTLIEDIIRNNIKGDLIETGVWRGGATIFMRAVLKAHGVSDRIVWVADSFEGFPSIKEGDAAYRKDALDCVSPGGNPIERLNDGGPMKLALSVSLDQVKQNFERFDLLDDQVRFLKGWFCDTLPTAPIERLSVLRLDGDLYQSTMDALKALYHKVSVGGYVIIDDYNSWPHCKQAVDDFRNEHCISEEIIEIGEGAIFWKVISNPLQK
jgi:hypothetical protein